MTPMGELGRVPFKVKGCLPVIDKHAHRDLLKCNLLKTLRGLEYAICRG